MGKYLEWFLKFCSDMILVLVLVEVKDLNAAFYTKVPFGGPACRQAGLGGF
jgi:hypothetical protein